MACLLPIKAYDRLSLDRVILTVNNRRSSLDREFLTVNNR